MAEVRTQADLDAFIAALRTLKASIDEQRATNATALAIATASRDNESSLRIGTDALHAGEERFAELGRAFEKAAVRLMGEPRRFYESTQAYIARLNDDPLAIMARNGLVLVPW